MSKKVRTEDNDITLLWDIGTAYEFFISLYVLHEPEKFGVRASWAAGIRSRSRSGPPSGRREGEGTGPAPAAGPPSAS